MIKLCWDSDVFISWIEKKDEAKLAILSPIVTAAQNGQICIVASYLAIAEVVRCNGDTPMTDEEEDRIRVFFKHPFIEVRPLDREIANMARAFCRTTLIERADAKAKRRRIHPPKLQVNDAIHVATALHYGCDVLQTYDSDLQRFDAKFGAPALKIRPPEFVAPAPEPAAGGSRQGSLFGNGETSAADGDGKPVSGGAVSLYGLTPEEAIRRALSTPPPAKAAAPKPAPKKKPPKKG